MRKLLRYSGVFVLAIIFSVMPISFASAQTNDHNLVQAVEQKISNYYPENNISVKAIENGRIELSGTVKVLYDRLRLFDLVSGVKGVHYIENKIWVNTTDLPDNEILANINMELNVVKSISEPHLLDIAVTNGVVILKGKVRFQRESTMLETVASWQEGVKGIVNELQVMPIMKAVSDTTLSETIADLLNNQFNLEKNVEFNVHLGHVNLDGKVRTLWAKHHIEKEIRRIVGVTKVTNNLVQADEYGA
jgi:osmotically-inducible protein OsmY